MKLIILSAILFEGCIVNCDLINYFKTSSGQIVQHDWLETGAMTLYSDKFTSVTSVGKTFKSPHIFTSVPDNGNDQLNSGYQSCIRIKDVVHDSTTVGPVSFKARVTQPNDSWCNYTW